MATKSASPYDLARELIDAAHRKDLAYLERTTHSEQASTPSNDDEPPSQQQDELAYADAVEEWAVKLLKNDPNASRLINGPGGLQLLRLAARCQHLERFLTPRSSFPDGKVGYLKWRKALYSIQADRAKELLSQAGINHEEQVMVRRWVSKTDLKPGKEDGDAGTQLLEDAAVFAFLQDQLAGFAHQHQDYTKGRFIGILAKTWKKLSPQAKAAALTIPMEPELKAVVVEAVAEVEKKYTAAAEREQQRRQARSQQMEEVKEKQQMFGSRPNPAKKMSSALNYQHVQRPETTEEAKHMIVNSEGSSAAPVFGSRLLKEGDDHLSYNAWDHVEPPPEYRSMIDELLAGQAKTKVSLEEAHAKFHSNAASHWDAFYSHHEHRFFKDRRWLHLEFPELVALTEQQAGERSIFEIGCGAGNTVFPLLERNENPRLSIFACDYSAEAVQVVRRNPMYSSPVIGRAQAFVWDLSTIDGLPNEKFQPGTLDVAVLIFVLSALHPREWKQAVDNVYAMLKPGGLALVRDYGRHDLSQLRFRKGRMLDDNFYIRGDGTRVYFFTPEELLDIFQASSPCHPVTPDASAEATSTSSSDDVKVKIFDDHIDMEGNISGASLSQRAVSATGHPVATELSHSSNVYNGTEVPNQGQASATSPAEKKFETVQLAVDRRMLVNRKEQKQMYRCWMQAKFRKI